MNLLKVAVFCRIGLSFLVFNFITLSVFSDHLVTPSEIINPHCLREADGELLILERGTVFVYEKKTGKFLRKFGIRGEGPGETQHFPNRGNMLRVMNGNVFIDGRHKIVQFSLDGKLIREWKKPWDHFVVEPLKDGWLTLHRSIDRKTKKFKKMVTLNSLDLKTKKRYISQTSNLKDFSLFPDALNFVVAGDCFYIENSKIGFHIDRYSLDGSYIGTIKNRIPPLKITKKDINFAYSEIAADPETKALGGLENFKKRVNVDIPKTFPAIKEMTSSSNYLFVKTFNQKKSHAEFHFYEFSGKYLGKTFLPTGATDAFDDYLTGRLDRYYCFDDFYYYYFVEDEDDETWEIHRIDWKKKIQVQD